MNKVLAVGILCCLGATVVSIISTAIPYWLHHEEKAGGQSITLYLGLWKTCVKYSVSTTKGSTCVNIENAPDWWKSVQALMILGILFLALSTFLGCLYCKDDSKQSLLHGAMFTAVLGGIALIIAVIVFGVKEKEISSQFHACFYLALMSGADAIVAAALMAISKRRGGYSSI
ncbi:claudin-1-like [Mercenaria mercenaria]|uniref:claudin-1-like n=1 Tax=Mercenaria mercenaria TaxID=6596 RepID=UPI001E1DF6CB|nr:claudin-1-like [Mercenaria mercenaria]XP_045171555.1 claudin-1-like [Mercenaria mercenaria]XP_045171556.1 claudin-1-like [Mercenaria mercenaria]